MPGLINDRSVRMSAFFDAGTVIDPGAPPVAGYSNFSSLGSSMRYSTGVGLAWVSPMGPLKFSVAVPLASTQLDHRQIFQFTFGGVF